MTGIRMVIAVTDSDWFETLRALPRISLANHWSTTARNFHSLQAGELLLFKLRAPHNRIAGGGVFHHSNILPCSLAWTSFRVANGAHSEQEMRGLIVRNRNELPDDDDPLLIGCRVLTRPFFFDEPDWIDVPNSWPSNVPQKKYDTGGPDATQAREALDLWHDVGERLNRQTFALQTEDQERFGAPRLIRTRLGQTDFRSLMTAIYRGQCAVTGERTLPALEAAHIFPHGDGGPNDATNGLLLRSDIHNLFDCGYVTVTPRLRFEVSGRISKEFGNGRHYTALHGHKITVPENARQRPDPLALTWHNENCFRG